MEGNQKIMVRVVGDRGDAGSCFALIMPVICPLYIFKYSPLSLKNTLFFRPLLKRNNGRGYLSKGGLDLGVISPAAAEARYRNHLH